MTTSFQTAWQEIEYYLDNGISIIPVRDKPQSYNGREYPIKSTWAWKKWQTEIITKAELMYLMTEKYDTIGYGIVAGKVSGNLVVIDVDVKNWLGIEAMLFQDLKSFFPDLFDKLRITQTPSKGYHIFYKVEETYELEGNRKLAYKEDAKEAAIESKGEGGYVVASTQMGYKVIKDNPIPTLTASQHLSIFALCEGYNQKVKVQTVQYTAANKSDYYDEDPFTHYNNSPAAENILTENGWSPCGSNNRFIWFTRPGKNTGISASFNREKRCYYIFTSSTELEPSKGYNPASLLAILQFRNDKKATYNWLVDNHYGKISAKKEKQIANNAARKGYTLPKNISENAKKIAEELQEELLELHPHGTFWDYDDDGKMSINREKLLLIANYLGFRYHKGNVVRVNGYLIHKIEEREFQDAIKDYIKEPDNEELFKILNAIEAFMEAHGKYTMKRLPILSEDMILKDNAYTCFKYYLNGYLVIDRDSITFAEYDALEMLIWAEKLHPRNYNKGEGGKYLDFLKLAIGEEHLEHTRKVLGFLTHEYKDETTGFIIVLTEQCRDPRDGGGSGKNVFCSLLKHSTTYTSKPGAQTKFDEKFFQSWNGQRIFCISDVPKNFDFAFLKEPSTGSFIWKKLFKDEVEVSNDEAPKFIVQTNFSYEISDGGLKRRIIPIEFTNFFTVCGGLDVHFGCHFPRGWTIDDWAGFDNFIAESVQEWLKCGKKLVAPELTNGGWLKQFEQSYGSVVYNFIELNFTVWCERANISNDTFKSFLEGYYTENNIPKQYQPSTQKINAAIKEYATKHDVLYEHDVVRRVDAVTQKYRVFTVKMPF